MEANLLVFIVLRSTDKISVPVEFMFAEVLVIFDSYNTPQK